MTKCSFPLVCLLLFSFLSLQKLPAAVSEAEVDRLVARHLVPRGPGLSVVVRRGGETLFSKSYGLSNVANGTPITKSSMFDLASVSKPITSTAVLILLEQGKLRLDQSLKSVVPDFKVQELGRPVTIRDLLQHTSGLADYTVSYPGSDREFAALTPETHLLWINKKLPLRQPGRRFQYNNSNYALLSLVVERLSGLSYAQFVRRNIFLPAGMTEAMVYDGTRNLPALAVNGYRVRSGTIRRSEFLTDITGDGNVYCSAVELSRFIRAIQTNQLISQATRELAWLPARLDDGRLAKDGYGELYGLGWELLTQQRVGHSGSWFGSSTWVTTNRENGLTLIILSNDENHDVISLGQAILQVVK